MNRIIGGAAAEYQEAEEALRFADPLALRGLLYQLTGDESLRAIELAPMPGMFAGEMAGLANPADLALLHEKTLEMLRAHDAGELAPLPATRERLREAIALAVGEPISDADADFWIEELAVGEMPRGLSWDGESPDPDRLRDFHVVVIGAGLAGVNAAIQLKRAGIPFTVLEKNTGVGGTWFQNTYPGARVDVPSRVYSHTFAVDYPFTHLFAPQEENERYLNWCADEFAVRQNIVLETEVRSATWDEASSTWRIEATVADGSTQILQANAIISAVGFMDRPKIPEISGLADFAGQVFHTAQWNHDFELPGSRVAVIGTGASSCQLVPEIAETAGCVTVFQRHAPWVLAIPNNKAPLSPEMLWLDRNLPYYPNWFRLRAAWSVADHNFRPLLYRDPNWSHPISISPGNHAVLEHLTGYIQDQVGDDAELLAKTMPDYPPFAKRFVVDNGWFDALKRDSVELVTEGIERVSAEGVVTTSGRLHPTDAIVLATGFHATDYLWPMDIVGRAGESIEKRWSKDGARAYKGITVPGFPNFFMLYGPNTNAFANGPVVWGELQTRYALEWIKLMLTRDVRSVDVTQAAYDDFNSRLDERLGDSVWLDDRQRSYYVNDFGRVATNGPWSTEEYWHLIRHPDTDAYELS